MHDDLNEPLEERRSSNIIDAARASYHVPPPTPRDAMWAEIERATSVRPIRRSVTPAWWGAMAAGVVLAAGIAIGRWSSELELPTTTPSKVAATAGKPRVTTQDTVSALYQLAAVQHLTQTEVFLTEFRGRAGTEASNARLDPWARDLLATTRLMMDSPVGDDARLRSLLEDLELVLAQIVQHSATGRAGDRDMIERTLEQRAVLGKIRTTIPSGAISAGI